MTDPAPAALPDPLHKVVALLAAFSAPFIAAGLAKYGIVVPTEQIVAAEIAAAFFIGGHVIEAIHARSVARGTQTSGTAAIAVADLNKGPAQ